MFNNLFVLEKERTGKEAFGFYLGYLLLLLLLSAFIGFFVFPPNPSLSLVENLEKFAEAGGYFGIIFSLVLSFAVLFKKEKLQNFRLVIIALLSGVGAIILGGILGLVPAAYLTTIPTEVGNKTKHPQEKLTNVLTTKNNGTSIKERYIGLLGINLIVSMLFVSIQGNAYPSGLNAVVTWLAYVLAPFAMVIGSSLILPFVAYCVFLLLNKPPNKTLIFYICAASSLVFWIVIFGGYFFGLQN
jgi:hypothetical protein